MQFKNSVFCVLLCQICCEAGLECLYIIHIQQMLWYIIPVLGGPRKEAVFVSVTGCLYISEFPWVILPGCPVLLFYIIWDIYRYLMMKSFVKQA